MGNRSDFKIDDWLDGVEGMDLMNVFGRVTDVVGTLVRASVPYVKIGEICMVSRDDGEDLMCEVIGFTDESVFLAPYGDMKGISPGSSVKPTGKGFEIKLGEGLLGRVINARGEALDIDEKGPLVNVDEWFPVVAPPTPAMKRKSISEVLSVGVRAIDGVLTLGKGQRVGVFAQAGDGKSTLMGMIARNTTADVNVICLVGERGREVKDFIKESLGEEGLKRSVVVVSTSDESSQMRVNGAYVGTCVAEYFRAKGKDVLLMMDSVTRYARALREIGLAAGEPPARGGFTPSVFFMLPKLLERPGRDHNGSITAMYTILLDGGPIGEEVRSILDGHMILSRELAAEGWRPAIEVPESVSRLFLEIATPEQLKSAELLRMVLSKEKETRLLRRIGEYKKGTDQESDFAISYFPRVKKFLLQSVFEKSTFEDTMQQLLALFPQSAYSK